MWISKKFLLLIVCLVALLSGVAYAKVVKLPQVFKESIKNKINDDFLSSQVESLKVDSTKGPKNVSFSFAVVSDVHNNLLGLKQAVKEINLSTVDFVVGLGDYTNVGTEAELTEIKEELKLLTKSLYLLPGDHDLWNGRDKKTEPLFYYKRIFGQLPKSISFKDAKLLFINNADLYQGVSEEDLSSLIQELQAPDSAVVIVLSHKAIYHPLTIHRMGYVQEDKVEVVLNQVDLITDNLSRASSRNLYLLHGDLHNSSRFTGPTDSITNYTIGALSKGKNFQTPRYAIVEVFEDSSIEVRDVPLM